MNNLHMDRLEFLTLWRNNAQTVLNFVAGHRNIFTLNAIKKKKMLNKNWFYYLPAVKAYSEMWTKISSPPLCGVKKPWPLDRLKLLTIPFSTGFSNAFAELKHKIKYFFLNQCMKVRWWSIAAAVNKHALWLLRRWWWRRRRMMSRSFMRLSHAAAADKRSPLHWKWGHDDNNNIKKKTTDDDAAGN